MHNELIDKINQEHAAFVKNLYWFNEKGHELQDTILKIKLGFLTFLGVIITVTTKQKTIPSIPGENLGILLIEGIAAAAFSILAIELWLQAFDIGKGQKKQKEKTVLSKIRIEAAGLREENKSDPYLYGRFNEYVGRAETILSEKNPIETKIKNFESIGAIIKEHEEEPKYWKITHNAFNIIWTLMVAGTPILLLILTLKGKI